MSKTTIRVLFTFSAILLLIITSYNVVFVASQMSDENWYVNRAEGVIIFDVISGGVSEEAGLVAGDRLVMINGDSIQSANHAQSYLDNAEPGSSLIYTIERDGRIFDVKVNLALAGIQIWIVGFLFGGFLFLIYSLFIIFNKPEDKNVQLLALATLLLSFFFMNMQQTAYIGLRPSWYQILLAVTVIIDFIAIALFSHASLNFPEKKYTHIKRFSMIYSHYIIAGIMIITSLNLLIFTNSFNNFLFAVPLIYYTYIEGVNWRRRRKEYLARVKIIKIAMIILLLAFLFIFFSEQIDQLSIRYLTFLICLLPIAYFITTIRYRIYDIYIRVRLSLVYSIVQTFVFIVFIISLALLIRLLPLWEIDFPAIFITGSSIEIRNSAGLDPTTQKQIQQGYLLFFGISISIILYLFKNRLQKTIESLFFQQKHDYRSALKRSGELLSSYFTIEEISQKSVEQVHEFMKVKGTALALSQDGNLTFTSAKGDLSNLTSLILKLDGEISKHIIKKKAQLKPDDLSILPIPKDKSEHIYCGMPVITGQNKLEAILFTAEKLSESAYNNDDLELLNLLAENLGIALERARLYEEMAEKQRLEREMEIARDIQVNSLPKCDPDYSGLQICSALAPANEVGGDYYDYLEMDDHQLGVIIGDVVGKGTSGAIHMSKIQGFLQTIKLEHLPSSEMFNKLNTLIRRHFEPDFFFTALYGHFNTQKRTAEIFRLGHNGLIYYNADNKSIKVIEPGGIAFGMAETDKFKSELESIEISYAKDDIFVFLTDGFYEAMDEKKQPFGEENICRLISSNPNDDAPSLMDRLQRAIQRYTFGIQRDDATGIVIKILK
jgi:serine phosphatase RsbU (regulator of sigma subunit)